MVSELKVKPDRDQAYVPIPMEAADFTLNEEWLDYIENDKLKTTMLNMKSAHIMNEIQELSWEAIFQTNHPVLTILAENDRLVDNNKVQQFMGHMFSKGNGNRLVKVERGHAIQFEMSEKIAGEIIRFIQTI